MAFNKFFRAAFPEPFPVDTTLSVRNLFRFRLRGAWKIRLFSFIFLFVLLLFFSWVWGFPSPISTVPFSEELEKVCRFLVFYVPSLVVYLFQLVEWFPGLSFFKTYSTDLVFTVRGYTIAIPPFSIFYGVEFYLSFLLIAAWYLFFQTVERFPPSPSPSAPFFLRYHRYYVDNSWDIHPYIPYPPLAVLHWSYKRGDGLLQRAELEDLDSVLPDPPVEWKVARLVNRWVGRFFYLLCFPVWCLMRVVLFPFFVFSWPFLFLIRLFRLREGVGGVFSSIFTFFLNRFSPPLDFLFQRIYPLYSGYKRSVFGSFGLVLDSFYQWAQTKIFNLELWEEFLISTTYEKWRKDWLQRPRKMRIRLAVYQFFFIFKRGGSLVKLAVLPPLILIFKVGLSLSKLICVFNWLVATSIRNLFRFAVGLLREISFFLYRLIYLNRVLLIFLLPLTSPKVVRALVVAVKWVSYFRSLYLRFFFFPAQKFVNRWSLSVFQFFYLLPDRLISLEKRVGVYFSYLFWYFKVATFFSLLLFLSSSTAYQIVAPIPYKPGYTEGGVVLFLFILLLSFSDRFKRWSWWDLRDFFILNLILMGFMYGFFLLPSGWVPDLYIKIFEVGFPFGSTSVVSLCSTLFFWLNSLIAFLFNCYLHLLTPLFFYPVYGSILLIATFLTPLFPFFGWLAACFGVVLFYCLDLSWGFLLLFSQYVAYFYSSLVISVGLVFDWIVSFFSFVVFEVYWLSAKQFFLSFLNSLLPLFNLVKKLAFFLVDLAPTGSERSGGWWGW